MASAAIGAIGSLAGSALGFLGSGRASKAISDANIAAEHGVLNAAQSANDALGSANTNASTLYNPYVAAGNQGLSQLQNYAASNPTFKFNPQDYFNSPGYQFQLKEGQNAINNSASAMGLGSSGNTLRDLSTFGQGLAANYYNQAFNQAQSTFQTNQNATLQNLGALVNAGEFGAGNLANENFNVALNQGRNSLTAADLAGNFAVGAGQARAGGILGQYNNLASGISGLASYGQGLAANSGGVSSGAGINPFGEYLSQEGY